MKIKKFSEGVIPNQEDFVEIDDDRTEFKRDLTQHQLKLIVDMRMMVKNDLKKVDEWIQSKIGKFDSFLQWFRKTTYWWHDTTFASLGWFSLFAQPLMKLIEKEWEEDETIEKFIHDAPRWLVERMNITMLEEE